MIVKQRPSQKARSNEHAIPLSHDWASLIFPGKPAETVIAMPEDEDSPALPVPPSSGYTVAEALHDSKVTAADSNG